MAEQSALILGALLHDIGKFWQRSGIRRRHENLGAEFLDLPVIRDKIETLVKIVANDNAQVVVKVLDNQGEEVQFQQGYYPRRPGTRATMRVGKVNAQGRITQVVP